MCLRKPSAEKPAKRVAWATEPEEKDLGSNFNEELGEIRSLCTALENCHQKVRSLGFLNCSKGYRNEFYNTSVPDTSERSLPLSKVLFHDGHTPDRRPPCKQLRISREDRKRLSLHISISLLQLYQTRWITGEWNGDEIIFKGLDGKSQSSVLGQPYLRRRFPQTAATPKDTQAIVFRLGVLLLELCLGEGVTDRCPQGKEPEWKAAYDCWEQYAKAEEGPEIAEAIRRCLEIDFPTESKSLESKELRKALYNQVVRPLKEALEHFRVG
jgi:hypothetical protein